VKLSGDRTRLRKHEDIGRADEDTSTLQSDTLLSFVLFAPRGEGELSPCTTIPVKVKNREKDD
jgi:hypothetical protein